MEKLSELIDRKIKAEYGNEYGNEYAMKKYTGPKIYHGGVNFDLKKRWYVYYSYRNPVTNELERQTPIYFNINKDYHTKKERLERLNILRCSLKDLLDEGYSPYASKKDEDVHSVDMAIKYALEIKRKTSAESTYKGLKFRVEKFVSYLRDKGLHEIPITMITKSVVVDFLYALSSKSNTDRRNYKNAISTIFTTLTKNDIISHNFIRDIDVEKSAPEQNRAYTINQANDIYEYLEKDDPLLLLFIKFVSYNLLRPIEVCRLKVGDIDLSNKLVYYRAKNKPTKTKIIPDILIQDLKVYMEGSTNKQHFLFTTAGIGPWDPEKEITKREYFSRRYQHVKKRFGLGREYTIYSFRHTFITKLFKELSNKYTKTEVLDRLMLITGHTTLSALKQYLRDIDAELPEDYSDLLM